MRGGQRGCWSKMTDRKDAQEGVRGRRDAEDDVGEENWEARWTLYQFINLSYLLKVDLNSCSVLLPLQDWGRVRGGGGGGEGEAKSILSLRSDLTGATGGVKEGHRLLPPALTRRWGCSDTSSLHPIPPPNSWREGEDKEKEESGGDKTSG